MTKLTVTTAKSLPEAKKKELEKAFRTRYDEFVVEYVVSDALIGGMIIFDGDKMYDGSVARQLDRFLDARKGNV